MQAVSPTLTAACSALGQRPCFYAEFSWDDSGNIALGRGGAGWTNESSYLIRHTGGLRINPPGERLVPAGDVGRASVDLDNSTGRFSWKRTDGALYAYIGGATGLAGKPVRLYSGYITANGPEYVRVFTGMVEDWIEKADGTVTLNCRDWGYKYLQDKRSSLVYADMLPDEWITILAGFGGIPISLTSLDVGIYQIPWVWLDDEPLTEEIWEAAGADGGLAWFNQNGVLVYKNPLAWSGQSSVWTFGDGTYEEPEPEIDIAPVATKIQVEWSGREASAEAEVYRMDRAKVILPHTSESWTARFGNAALTVRLPDYRDPYNDYYAVSGGGLDISDQLIVDLFNTAGQQTTVNITNNSTTQAARLISFRLRGQPLVGGPTEQAEALASPAPFTFERLRSERGNSYCQTAAQGAALAQLLALRGRRVRPIYTLKNVPGVPQLELGDTVTFADRWSLGAGGSVQAVVVEIAWEAYGGFYQNLRLMDVTDLAEYTNYFVIGTSKLGGLLSGYARAYY